MAAPPQPLLWVELQFKAERIPALIDTGAQFSCVRADTVKRLREKGEICNILPCSVKCLLADGRTGIISQAAKLRVRLLSFSWYHNFKVLNEGPFPVILGLDFLRRTQMQIDIPSSKYSFGFDPSVWGPLSPKELSGGDQRHFTNLNGSVADIGPISEVRSCNLGLEALREKFPDLFSTSLGTARCTPYEIELSDATPVRSRPYRCAPPKLAIFKRMVNELLEQGVIRASKSQYASPALLVPKSGGGLSDGGGL